MLVAAAVCPHPPLLVPGVAAGAEPELDRLRAACDAAVRSLLAEPHDLLVVVGAAPALGPWPAGAGASLAPYGVPVDLGIGDAEPHLPLALALGAWLVRRADPAAQPLRFGVPPDAEPDRCAQVGAALAERGARVGLLVTGDGSARRSPKGPGHLDQRAEPFDAAVSAALAAGDVTALAGIDPGLADQLLVPGRAAWQVLAGAAGGRRWSGEVTYDEAPYGVAYLVASWRPDADPVSAGE
jgi:hypothetical protein